MLCTCPEIYVFESVRTLHIGSGAEIQKTLGPPASENTAVNSCCGTSQMAWPQHFKWQLPSYLTSAILKMRSYGPSLYLTQTKKVCASHSPVRGSLCQKMQHYLRARPFREGELVDAFITALYALGNHCGYGDLHDEMIRDRIIVGICNAQLSVAPLFRLPELWYIHWPFVFT